MNKTKTYYQPELYFDDGTNIGWDIPSELSSFQAFASEEDLREFMEAGGYKKEEYNIREYHDEDIEGVTILDGWGNVIEVNEEDEDDSLEEAVKSVCFGRDDLLAVAEKIVEESGIDEADGEALCEELARTCKDYLMWAGTAVK